LAAHRVGLRTVILPKDNEKDLTEIPAEILSSMAVKFVENMDEVLQYALERPLLSSVHSPVPEVPAGFEPEPKEDQGLAN
jgi:ATP-dependent Lon protease